MKIEKWEQWSSNKAVVEKKRKYYHVYLKFIEGEELFKLPINNFWQTVLKEAFLLEPNEDFFYLRYFIDRYLLNKL